MRIMQQLGLGYLPKVSRASSADLRRQEEPASEAAEPPFFDEALLLYSRPLLDALNAAPGRTASLFEIIEKVRLPIEDALRILPELERYGYITIVERDLKGDHRLRLTERGADKLTG
jgi:hypothetical protein